MLRNLIACFLIFALLAPATAAQLALETETGLSSLAQVFEEEEDDDRFSFWRSRLGWTQGEELSKLRLELGRSQRDYEARSSDFVQSRFETEFWKKTSVNMEPVRLGAGIAQGQKIYETLTGQSFRETGGKFFAEDYAGWDLGLAAHYFDFETGSDESKISAALGKTLESGPYKLGGQLRSERHWADQRRKFKQEVRSSFEYKPLWNHWRRTFFSAAAGQRDSKNLEERDDNVDFSFWEVRWNNAHPLRPGQEATWSWTFKNKNDQGPYSHHGIALDGSWNWAPEREGRIPGLKIKALAGWKKMEFPDRPSLTYTKTSLGGAASTRIRNEWHAQAYGRLDFYDFTNQARTRLIPVAQVEIGRALTDSADVALSASLRQSYASLSTKFSLRI